MMMPREGIDPDMFAPCGMNCMVCYRHCSSKKPCEGCRKSGGGKPGHCRECKIKDCVRDKGAAYCFLCPEYPCKRIRNLEKSYRARYGASLMENSAFVQASGLEAFMRRQKERYACPACGGVISLHDGECSECRAKAGTSPG